MPSCDMLSGQKTYSRCGRTSSMWPRSSCGEKKLLRRSFIFAFAAASSLVTRSWLQVSRPCSERGPFALRGWAKCGGKVIRFKETRFFAFENCVNRQTKSKKCDSSRFGQDQNSWRNHPMQPIQAILVHVWFKDLVQNKTEKVTAWTNMVWLSPQDISPFEAEESPIICGRAFGASFGSKSLGEKLNDGITIFFKFSVRWWERLFDFWAISLCLMFEVTFVGFSLVLASVKHSYMNTKSQSLKTIRNVLSWKETGNACWAIFCQKQKNCTGGFRFILICLNRNWPLYS